jgi:inosine/xanthosine triphosphatase
VEIPTGSKFTVAVGSTNPIKLNSSLNGMRQAMPGVELDGVGYSVSSGVSDQPMGDAETRLGAENRARSAFAAHMAATGGPPSYAVGLEGGVLIEAAEKTGEVGFGGNPSLQCFAWIAVFDGKRMGCARTSAFALPPAICALVAAGMELGDADDKVFGSSNAKQAGGTVGHLTRGVIDRTLYYEQAVVLAFIPFHWPDLYTVT